jgi:hypothetical protein
MSRWSLVACHWLKYIYPSIPTHRTLRLLRNSNSSHILCSDKSHSTTYCDFESRNPSFVTDSHCDVWGTRQLAEPKIAEFAIALRQSLRLALISLCTYVQLTGDACLFS